MATVHAGGSGAVADPAPGTAPGTSAPPTPPAGDGSDATSPRPDAAGLGRRLRPWAGLAALYSALSVAVWWHVWWGHPAGTMTCLCGDPAQTLWFVGWVAHALAHLQDPFLSTAAAHPGGVNLLANQSSVLVGVAVAPVTWLFGPVAGLNVALTAAAPLDALAAVALCRRFTGWAPAALGGLLFGFAPLVVSELAFAHLADVQLAFLPLIALCLHELLVRRRRPPVRWGLALAGAVVGQFFVSAELLAATAALLVPIGGGVAVVAAVRGRRLRRSRHQPPAGEAPVPWSATIRGLAVAVVVAVAALVWPVWFALDGPRHVSGAVWAGTADAGSPWESFFRLPVLSAADIGFTHYGGYLGATPPPESYLGPGVLLVLAVGLVVARRRPPMWVACWALVVAAVLSLGAFLLPFAWYSAWWLPWRLVDGLPVLQSIVPQRLMALGDLAAAVGVAVALDAVGGRHHPAPPSSRAERRPERPLSRWRGPWRPAVAAGLAVVAVVPVITAYQLPLTTTAVRPPAWFTRVAPHLRAGSVLLTLPFPTGRIAEAMGWQALDGFRFALAGAYAKLPGPAGTADYGGSPGSASWALSQLSEPTEGLPAPSVALSLAVRRAMARWGVTEVVATGRQVGAAYAAQYAAGFMTAVLGRPPVVQDGAWVWSTRAGSGPPPVDVTQTQLEACVATTDHRTLPLVAVPDCVMLAGG